MVSDARPPPGVATGLRTRFATIRSCSRLIVPLPVFTNRNGSKVATTSTRVPRGSMAIRPCTVLLPKKAISVISAPGQKFHDPVADRVLFDSIKAYLRKDIEVIEMDCAVNDAPFAEACVKALLKNIQVK